MKRYNIAVGGKNTETGGYHETITVAWIKLLDGLRREACAQKLRRAEFARLAVERFVEDKEIFRRYYGFDLAGSVEARRDWIEPTLASLD